MTKEKTSEERVQQASNNIDSVLAQIQLSRKDHMQLLDDLKILTDNAKENIGTKTPKNEKSSKESDR